VYSLTLGKDFLFAECLLAYHSAKKLYRFLCVPSLSSAMVIALGKTLFVECNTLQNPNPNVVAVNDKIEIRGM
jgi:hypothetical protein